MGIMTAVIDRKVTLADVAKETGLSKATVSRVLNDSDLPSESARRKVQDAATRMGYVPDPVFRRIARRKHDQADVGNLGLILGSFGGESATANPYYMRLLWSVEQGTKQNGRNLNVLTVENSSATYIPDIIKDGELAGAILMGIEDRRLIDRIRSLIPVVLLNIRVENTGIPSIFPNESIGIYQAMEYLVQLGHQRIYFLNIAGSTPGHTPNLHHIERGSAFEQYIHDNQYAIMESRAILLEKSTKSMVEACIDLIEEWRTSETMPTAVICATDFYALSMMEAAEKVGLSVPSDLSIIGGDDIDTAQHVRPALTTIRQPFESMGIAAVDLLLALKPQGMAANVTQIFDVELVVRDSCTACRPTDGIVSKECLLVK